MNIERALATHGFMSETELTYLAELASRSKAVVEIGSWRGRSARAIADNLMEGGTLICVDTWSDDAYGHQFEDDPRDLCQHPEWLWNEFHKNLEGHIGVTVFPARMTSMEAATKLQDKRFDVIFIDAGHWYEDVIQDILHWRQLLTSDGILCGHDYNPVHHPDVIRAVDELIPKFRVIDTIWTTEGL